MAEKFVGAGLAILGVALALSGCSPGSMVERLPSDLGGLPSDAPSAPHTGFRYPAVHDTPPPRSATPLTDEQQLELEKQLQNARQRQENEAAGMEKEAPEDGAETGGK